MQFKVRRILPDNIQKEIEEIGFSPLYLDFGAKKHQFLNIKIYDLKPQAATILKQTALSAGADCAVNKGVLDFSTDKSDVILSATVAQMKTIAEKLKYQQFSMSKLSDEISAQIEIFEKNLTEKTSKKPIIMGILNITDDSFSDGGSFLDPKKATEHAYKMIKDGAKIIDIGAESTRPGAVSVPPEVEIERITPVIKELKKNTADIKISIDTRNAKTARVMANFGADIINDVSGLNYDDNMAKTLANAGLEIVITHSRGTPGDMDNFSEYKNVADEVYFELYERVQKALEAGVQPGRIIIDPGFGFAKNIEQNFQLARKIEEFKSMGYRLLCGVSRKRFIKSLVNEDVAGNNEAKTIDILDDLTAGLSLYFGYKNVDIIRVHNVLKTRPALDLAEKIRRK